MVSYASVPGGLVLWKPSGITSRHALNTVERRLGRRPLGHTGTLDPLASGILVLLGGESRKFQDYLMGHTKVYDARVVLGIGSRSDDAEGPLWCPLPRRDLPSENEIQDALKGFKGETLQTPPQLSAVRVGGRRAYARARDGEEPAIRPRRVHAHEIELINWKPPVLQLRVTCGSGYYMRSLARDLGAFFEVGGFLAICRTELGCFSEAEAVPLATLTRDHWVSTERLLEGSPRTEVDPGARRRLAHGQHVPVRPTEAVRAAEMERTVVWCEERVLGLAEVRGGVLYPRRWLASESA